MTSNENSRKIRETCVLVLDANILIKDFWWEGRSPQHLINRLFLLHTIVVPELALLEASTEIARRASDLLVRIDKSGLTPRLLSQYQRLFRKTTKDGEDGASLSKRYEEYIRELVSSHGGLVAPTPDLPLATIVERSVLRVKPFNRGDKGFRDTLLWLGVLDLIQAYKRVSFVSANTDDFSDKDRELHPDLAREVDGVLPENIRFRYFPSLDEFIASMDPNGEGSAEAFLRALLSSGFRGFDLFQWLSNNFEDVLADHELDGVQWAGMPYWAEDPRLVSLEEIVSFEPCNAASRGSNKVEFLCHVGIIGIFSCSILYASWESALPPQQVVWIDEDSDDMWTEVGVRSIGTFTLRIVFDLNSITIVEYDVAELEHDFEAAIEALEEANELSKESVDDDID